LRADCTPARLRREPAGQARVESSGYSATWRYSFANPPKNLTQTADAFGPIALLGDKLVAVGGDCVYLATSSKVVAVDPAVGWSPIPRADSTAVELSASRTGVFWTTPIGGVEALWR
jgi:hypothetical protein